MDRADVVRTDRLSLSFEDHGAGEPVVLVHGWPDSARGWRHLRDGLVADGFRVIVPELRGFGATRFLDESAVRDGSAAAISADVCDLVDALGADRFAVVGHDWGARVAYALAAAVPERLSSIAALALGYQPRGEFTMPDFGQARRFWYQWLMYVDAGAEAIRADPIGFARIQWDTWSPPGWFDDDEFAATAEAFANPDWVDVTLHAYRSRFLPEPLDPVGDPIRAAVATTETIAVPTLMIQGGADACDPPSASDGLERFFTDYRRVVLGGVGHFPHREAPADVLDHVRAHLRRS